MTESAGAMDGGDDDDDSITNDSPTSGDSPISRSDDSVLGKPVTKWGISHKDEKGRDLILQPVEAIPDDIHEFYRNVGYFTEQHTNKEVRNLAPHQVQVWNDRKKSKYRLYLKSQKIGLSTSILLEDLHIALTRGRGKEIFIRVPVAVQGQGSPAGSQEDADELPEIFRLSHRQAADRRGVHARRAHKDGHRVSSQSREPRGSPPE